jgi:exosortase
MQDSKISDSSKIASALNQHRLAITLKFSVIAIATVAFYFQDLSIIFSGATVDESMFHILAIPFIFAYLLYRKRKMIKASLQPNLTNGYGLQRNFSTISGILLTVISIFTYWYGSYTFTPLEYHMITLPFLLAGLILILFDLQTLKQLLFPVAFLIFLTPPPAEILYGVGSALANLSASASNLLANAFGLHSTLSTGNTGPIITLIRPNQTALPFNVDVACSGIYSIIGFVIFALFIAYITAGRLRNKFAILALGIPLILGLNIIRITTILAIGYNYGEDLALQIFHTVGATILMVIGTIVLLAIAEKAFKKPKPSPPCPTCNPTTLNQNQSFCPNCGKLLKYPKIKLDKTSIAKILGIIITVIMLLSIQVPVFALTQGPAQIMSQTPSGIQINPSNTTLPFPEIKGYSLNYVYRDSQNLSKHQATTQP